ncbi:MAG: hybrid sensor histidine kinase/response regulator [Archangium sp.]|nr:hybrid sensor histidine kinase/response regulator [Archangium sp.]
MALESERARAELRQALYQQAHPAMLFAGVALAITVFVSFEWGHHAGRALLTWAAIHVLVLLPYLLRDAWARWHQRTAPEAWWRWWDTTFTLSCIMWGVAGVAFFDPADPQSTQLRLGFFSGMAVVCLVAFSANYGFLRITAITALPQAAVMIADGTRVNVVMGVGLLAYLGMSVLVAVRLDRVMVRAAELRFRSEDLAENLRVEKERVEEAYRSKARFLAAASHDLRQPLHALSLFVELLDARVTDPLQRTFLQRIDASSHALAGLLNALLDLSRIDAGALRPTLSHFHLAVVFHELEAELAEVTERKGLALEFKPTPLLVETDLELLGRVLRNLLSNAVRYTRTGRIVVEARLMGEHRVAISVSDTGVGIPVAAQETVFEEFFQVGNPERDREQGLGLGLSIVRGICRTLGARVTLVSQPTRAVGTEFIVELPRGEPARVVERQAPRPVQVSGLAGRKVLVLDDERDVRDGMSALLESWSCQALCAGSLAEARSLLEGQRAPDAVVCDYRLPENVTGVNAIEQLEQHLGARLPALLVTGDTSPERLREMKHSGHPVLFKPVLPGKLRAALSALLAPAPPA